MARIIPLAYASLGAFTIVVQTILLREFFVVAAGNEVSFGIAMAGWLLGVGAGSLAGAFFSTRRYSTAVPFAWATLALCASAALILAAIRSLHSLAGLAPGTLLPLATALALVPLISLPFCVLSGFAFPLAARLRPQTTVTGATAVAGAYIWESLGAMAGGALHTFLLLGRLAPIAIIVLFALPLLATAAAVSRLAPGGRRSAGAALLALLLAAVALAAGLAGRCDSWLARQRWRGMAAAELVEARDTRFQNLELGKASGQYSLFANGQLTSVFPDDAGNELLAAQLLCQHPKPRRVLVIGDACAGLAKHLLRYPLLSLTAVAIDPGAAQMIMAHMSAEDRRALADPRLRLHFMDGRRFVMQAARQKPDCERFDLVFVNQPDAWTAHFNRYYTQEFFRELRRILTPGGVVALRLAAAENYASELVIPYTTAIFRTLESVFPAIALSPGGSSFLFASGVKSSVTEDPHALRRRYLELAPAPARLAPVFASLYPAERIASLRSVMGVTAIPSLNRDDRPIGYFLGSRLLGWSTGSPLPKWLDRFDSLLLPILLAFLALLSLLMLRRTRQRRGSIAIAPAVLAAFGGGFAGLSMEITAILVFQNTWGFVYQAVGMLIALFMMGLGTGAAWTLGRIGKRAPSAMAAARELSGMLLLLGFAGLSFLLLLPLLQHGGGTILLAAWLGGIGILAGAILPLGLRVLDRIPAGSGAGFLNAGDYLGGAAGSMLTAAFFLPLLGSGKSLVLISFVAVAAGMPLALATRRGNGGKSGDV